VRPGANGGNQGLGQGNEQNDQIYRPYTPATQPGQGETVSGQQGQGGTTQQQPGGPGPGINPGAQVPYEEVYGEYSDAASEALDRSAIPPHLKGYVRDYFGELAPDQ
jgi:hypothetical protein